MASGPALSLVSSGWCGWHPRGPFGTMAVGPAEQPFAIENRARGAGGLVGTDAVVHSPTDGYTLLLVVINHVIGDAPQSPQLRVHARRPSPALLAHQRDARASVISSQDGSRIHRLTWKQIRERSITLAGVDMVHVPYRGSPLALTDLLGGQVQVMFDNIPSSIESIWTWRCAR